MGISLKRAQHQLGRSFVDVEGQQAGAEHLTEQAFKRCVGLEPGLPLARAQLPGCPDAEQKYLFAVEGYPDWLLHQRSSLVSIDRYLTKISLKSEYP